MSPKIILLMISSLCGITGVLFLFSPRILLKLTEKANTVLFQDSFFIRENKITGAVLVCVGLLLLYLSK